MRFVIDIPCEELDELKEEQELSDWSYTEIIRSILKEHVRSPVVTQE